MSTTCAGGTTVDGTLGTVSLPVGGSCSLTSSSTAGTYEATLTHATFGYLASAGTWSSPVPEVDVLGNATSIADGDLSPTVADHTDVGTTTISGGSVERTFTIKNTGSASLNLTGAPIVAVSGANATDFIVTQQAMSPVAINASTTFKVTFGPSALGLRTATISIANDDVDENPYTFSIQGTGDIAPSIVSINRKTPTAQNTNADTLVFEAVFSEAVVAAG